MQRFTTTIALLFFISASAFPQVVGAVIPGEMGQMAAPPSNTPPEQRCVIAGHVNNAMTGEPLKKVSIRLASHRGSNGGGAMMGTFNGSQGSRFNAQGYSATTENDGGFRIEGVEPGQYTLSGNRSGFLNASYGAKTANDQGTVITLSAAQQLTDISLALTPQAVITGKVVDGDGDPVSGGMVQVLVGTWMRGKLHYTPRGGNQINDLGEYRIPNLSPGKYYILAQSMNHGPVPQEPAAQGKPDMRLIRTFYPGAVTFSGATPIDIKAGQDATGVDIRMQSSQTYHIRGKVAGFSGEKARDRGMISVSPRDEDIVMFSGGQSSPQPDGSFDIAGVAPGSYYLNLFSMGGPIRSSARQSIDVGAGDVDGVVLTATPPGSLRGVARLEGTPSAGSAQASAANLHLSLQPSETMGMMGPPPSAKFASDGSFTMDNVSAGKFFVQAGQVPGAYLKSIRYGNSEILGKELDLSGGAGGELEIVYRYGPGEVDGKVDLPQAGSGASSSASLQIVLVPEVLNADGSGLRMATADSSASFTLTGLSPGRYRAYAFEQVNFNELQNPELLKQLESKGSSVEVKENDKKQIQLPLISLDDLNQLFLRAGVQPQ